VLAVDTSPLRRPPRLRPFVVLAVAAMVVTAGGLIVAARRTVDSMPVVDSVAGVLSEESSAVENFLLVGSDSRTLGDPNTGDSAEEAGVSGTRSDTIMVLRRDRATGEAALLSIPRDLYVEIPGQEGRQRINAAYNGGPATLVRTVQESLGIPVHHYVEIDFTGFTRLVDALGGVEICFDFPARDVNTGLDVRQPGCRMLDGTQALAYARSRYYEELKAGEWVLDPRSDIGRAERQREFVAVTLASALDAVVGDPLGVGALVEAVTSAVRIDSTLDPIVAAGSLRGAVRSGLTSVSLPVSNLTVDGNAVLELQQSALPLLAWFAGSGPRPAGI
jgi:LCP family protein required for cell wall assembly